MKVPRIDLSGQHQSLLANLLDAVARVIDSQQFGAVFSRLTEQQQRYVGEVLSKFVVAGKATGRTGSAGSPRSIG